MSKPICSLSLDLDNQWSYMKTHGDSGWESFPSYLDLVVPRALDILRRFDWKITFFVVGQDAALEKNRDALASIAEAGHEVGNHSFHHEPWLHLYTKEQTVEEIARAEESIEAATGRRPCGFRGPGYSLSRTVVEVLAERGYRYDASTLPTFLGPFARAYYFHTANLNPEEKEQRRILFGGFKDGLRPVKPYRWNRHDVELLEIPVTTLPGFKIPFHFSYLLYLAKFSPSFAMVYFRMALALCRLTGTQPSLLLHPLDILGGDDVPALKFFPAMDSRQTLKEECLTRALSYLRETHTVCTLYEHAALAEGNCVAHGNANGAF